MGSADITPHLVITTQFISCEVSDVWTIKPLIVQPSDKLLAIQVTLTDTKGLYVWHIIEGPANEDVSASPLLCSPTPPYSGRIGSPFLSNPHYKILATTATADKPPSTLLSEPRTFTIHPKPNHRYYQVMTSMYGKSATTIVHGIYLDEDTAAAFHLLGDEDLHPVVPPRPMLDEVRRQIQ